MIQMTDHFGQNDLIPDFSIWETKMFHFGLKRSILVHWGPRANRALVIPDRIFLKDCQNDAYFEGYFQGLLSDLDT